MSIVLLTIKYNENIMKHEIKYKIKMQERCLTLGYTGNIVRKHLYQQLHQLQHLSFGIVLGWGGGGGGWGTKVVG